MLQWFISCITFFRLNWMILDLFHNDINSQYIFSAVNLLKLGDDIFYAILKKIFYLRKRHTTSPRTNQWKSFSRIKPRPRNDRTWLDWSEIYSRSDAEGKWTSLHLCLLVFLFSSLNITLALWKAAFNRRADVVVVAIDFYRLLIR